MIAWFLTRLKWIGLMMAALPFGAAYLSYDGAQVANAAKADGVEAIADIDGGTRSKRRRSGTSFSLDLTWTDTAGQTRRAEKVYLPRDMAERLIVDDQLTAGKIKILYFPDQPDKKPVFADDNARMAGDPITVGWGMFTSLLPLGLVGCLLFFLVYRREQAA